MASEIPRDALERAEHRGGTMNKAEPSEGTTYLNTILHRRGMCNANLQPNGGDGRMAFMFRSLREEAPPQIADMVEEAFASGVTRGKIDAIDREIARSKANLRKFTRLYFLSGFLGFACGVSLAYLILA